MARLDVGNPGLSVPASDRVAESKSYDQGQQSRQRQSQNRQNGGRHENPGRVSLFDLLFDEVDATPEIDEPVKRRLKQNVRRSFRRANPDAPPAPLAATAAEPVPPSPADDLVHVVVPAEDVVDTERLIRIASEQAEDELRNADRILEARRIATQLRYCLSQHTETGRKVSTYLRALLVVTNGSYKPKLVIEV